MSARIRLFELAFALQRCDIGNGSQVKTHSLFHGSPWGERKVRTPQGRIPRESAGGGSARGRRRISATENIPPRAQAWSKGEKVGQEPTALAATPTAVQAHSGARPNKGSNGPFDDPGLVAPVKRRGLSAQAGGQKNECAPQGEQNPAYLTWGPPFSDSREWRHVAGNPP